MWIGEAWLLLGYSAQLGHLGVQQQVHNPLTALKKEKSCCVHLDKAKNEAGSLRSKPGEIVFFSAFAYRV